MRPAVERQLHPMFLICCHKISSTPSPSESLAPNNTTGLPRTNSRHDRECTPPMMATGPRFAASAVWKPRQACLAWSAPLAGRCG